MNFRKVNIPNNTPDKLVIYAFSGRPQILIFAQARALHIFDLELKVMSVGTLNKTWYSVAKVISPHSLWTQ